MSVGDDKETENYVSKTQEYIKNIFFVKYPLKK